MMTADKRRNFFIILMLGVLTTISPFSIDLYLPAFPQIAVALHDSVANVSLSLSSYFIGLAVGQIVYGPLLDRFGRKKPLYCGLVLFIIASIGCILATNVETMIVFRFVQALGGCGAGVAATAMVRDFFPVKDSSKIFSLLMLILGVSPLLAPTVGGLVATHLGWQWIFILLITIVIAISIATTFLPEAHQPDPTVSLKIKPVMATFWAILKEPQFFTYTLAGAFSFAGLLTYVAGSSIIFINGFHVSVQAYGLIFASLTIGFIGGNQLNIWLVRKHQSETIFRVAITTQLIFVTIFLIGTWLGWYDLKATLVLLFLSLSCVGLVSPNGTALALAPFAKNAGSASALMGSLQIGVSALSSTGIAIFKAESMFPVIAIMFVTTLIGFLILMVGGRQIPEILRSAAHENDIMLTP